MISLEPNIERELAKKPFPPLMFYIDRAGVRRFGPFESALPFRDGRAAVEVDGAWHVIDADGRLVRLDGYRFLSALGGRRFLVRRKPGVSSGTIVDDEGRVIADGITAAHAHANGAIPFSREGRYELFIGMHGHIGTAWGLLRPDGSELVAPRFSGIEAPHENHILVCEDGRPSQWGTFGGRHHFIDVDGRATVPGTFTAASSFGDGIAAVRDAKGWHLIDASGRSLVTPDPVPDSIDRFDRGAACVTYGKGHTTWYRLMSRDGTPLTPDCAWIAWREGIALYATGKRVQGEQRAKACFIYTNGTTTKLDLVSSWPSDGFLDGVACMLAESGGVSFIKPDGTRFLEEQFYAAGPFVDGLAPIREAPPKRTAAKKPAKPAAKAKPKPKATPKAKPKAKTKAKAIPRAKRTIGRR